MENMEKSGKAKVEVEVEVKAEAKVEDKAQTKEVEDTIRITPQKPRKRLSEIFKDELRKRGVERIWPCDKIHRLAALVAEGKATVVRAKNCRKSMSLDGKVLDLPAQACVLAKDDGDVILSRKELIKAAEKFYFPYVVVDCRLHGIHTEKELRKMWLQLKCTSGVVREFMWCEKFVVTAKKFPEVNALHYKTTEDFLLEKGIERVVLLDPNAEEIFDGKEGSECYIVGGIVDLSGSKRGTTSIIGREIEGEGFDVISKKFELRGDVVGVPDRINSIVEILLKCVIDSMSVERAVLSSQTQVAARWRLRKELAKMSFRLDKVLNLDFAVRAVKKSGFNEVRWLNIRREDFYRECKRLGFVVVDDGLIYCR